MVTGIQKSSTFVPEIEQERSRISRTWQAVRHGPRHSFSVHSPFILRSISVLLSFDIRCTFVLHSFFLRSTTENKRKKTEKNGEQTNPKRRRSVFAANLQQTCGNFTTCIFLLRLSVFYYTNCIKSSNFAADFVFLILFNIHLHMIMKHRSVTILPAIIAIGAILASMLFV